jgi:uncharacterized protein YgbK (DUF1537 family)
VLLELKQVAQPDLSRGAELSERLAEFVGDAGEARKQGHKLPGPPFDALIATGGDTVYALLSRLQVHGIRLLDEVEPGVPLGITLGAISIPLVTKAGAFGDRESLRRSLERLQRF